jgi:hypothetical protein
MTLRKHGTREAGGRIDEPEVAQCAEKQSSDESPLRSLVELAY